MTGLFDLVLVGPWSDFDQ